MPLWPSHCDAYTPSHYYTARATLPWHGGQVGFVSYCLSYIASVGQAMLLSVQSMSCLAHCWIVLSSPHPPSIPPPPHSPSFPPPKRVLLDSRFVLRGAGPLTSLRNTSCTTDAKRDADPTDARRDANPAPRGNFLLGCVFCE